ncbi:transposase, partial [Tropicimonas sp. TH_r6]|nr:transposase [Tropicimonas sp. TH_r6]
MEKRTGKRGHSETFYDAAIRVRMSVKMRFGLPPRQISGVVVSLKKTEEIDRLLFGFSKLSQRWETLDGRIYYSTPY